MGAPFPDDLDVLAEVWECWRRAGQWMPAQLWDAPSSLAGWTVRELYAHVARGVGTLAGLMAEPVARPPELSDAAGYFAVLAARGRAGPQVADAARKYAADRSNAELTGHFGERAATALAGVRAEPGTVVATVAGSMRVADYALTRVVEATVHLLDLRESFPGADPPPDDAIRRTAGLLVELTPATDFIRLATGRPHPPVFPVLT